MNNRLSIRRIMKSHRNANGLSQRSAAKELGVSQQSLAFYETGKRKPVGVRVQMWALSEKPWIRALATELLKVSR